MNDRFNTDIHKYPCKSSMVYSGDLMFIVVIIVVSCRCADDKVDSVWTKPSGYRAGTYSVSDRQVSIESRQQK